MENHHLFDYSVEASRRHVYTCYVSRMLVRDFPSLRNGPDDISRISVVLLGSSIILTIIILTLLYVVSFNSMFVLIYGDVCFCYTYGVQGHLR
jgi:hypothetical protein